MKKISSLIAFLAMAFVPLNGMAADLDLAGYKLVKTLDFSVNAETMLTAGEKSSIKAWDNGNKKNQDMYECSEYEDIIFQAIIAKSGEKGFILGANSGLYSKSAQRCAAIVNRKKGDIVVFTTTQSADNVILFYKTAGDNLPDGNYNLQKKEDGKGYYAVMTDDGYVGFNGLNGKQAISKIEIYEPTEGTNLAEYTVKYVDVDGKELQEAVKYTGAIGMKTNVFPAHKPTTLTVDGTGYVLSSNDEGQKTVAADGSTTVSLTYEKTAPVEYTVNEVAGDIVFRTQTASEFTGTSITVPYRHYNVDENGQLYTKAARTSNPYYGHVFTLTTAGQVETLEYTVKSDVANVVFFSEGEDIESLTVCSGADAANSEIRSSNCAAAYAAEDAVITTLPAGVYKLTAVIFDASKEPSSDWVFRAGDKEIAKLHCTTVNYQELTSGEFTLYEKTPIIMAKAGSNKMGLDLIYIQKTGDVELPATVEATISTAGWTTFASNYALNLAEMTGATAYYANEVDATAKEVKVASTTATVKGGTGLILKGEAGAKVTIPVVAAGEALEGNLLVGCTAETTLEADETLYVLADNKGTAEFQSLAENGATIPAGHAYLKAAAAAARLSIVFEGEATGVAEVKKAEAADGAIYNLAGQRVAQPANGLYIVNGKKVIIK